ncbi:hypothetical protein GC173_02620 [bacterium]|nr:hypothetical protein [bacterium]
MQSKTNTVLSLAAFLCLLVPNPGSAGAGGAASPPQLLSTSPATMALPNVLFADYDNDGRADGFTDFDNDGTPEAFADLNSDGLADAFSDLFEDGFPDPLTDANGDGFAEILRDYNGNGLPDAFEDFDKDQLGRPDAFTDFDGDGVPDFFDSWDADGVPYSLMDFDGDGVPEALKDYDGNGIPEAFLDRSGDSNSIPEAFVDFDGDGRREFFTDYDGDGIPEGFTDFDGDGVPDALEDRNGDGSPDLVFDTNADGQVEIFVRTNGGAVPEAFVDYDGDGMPEALADFDEDGVPDAFEDHDRDAGRVPDAFQFRAGNGKLLFFMDRDGDGIPDGLADFDDNGVPEALTDKDGDGRPEALKRHVGTGTPEAFVDYNGDGKPEVFTDVNGDGKPEAFVDFNGDGKWDLFTDFNGDGRPECLTDYNGNGRPEFLTDHDGDGVPEGMRDFNGNAIPDALEDFDGNGFPDAFVDRTGPGDNDAIPEAFTDFNGDGRYESFTDYDGDGKPEAFTDYDGDGIPDALADRDRNGSPDLYFDTNSDGRVEIFIITNSGRTIPEVFTDFDGNGMPEALEDFDEDGMPDAFEDFNRNGVPDAFQYRSGNGQLLFFLDRDGNGIPEGLDDFDGDGVPEALTDRNGDQVPEVLVRYIGTGTPEALLDYDGNGIPEAFIDANGDGRPEAFLDVNGDGRWDFFTDFNGDGKPECLTDYDGNGRPEFLTVFSPPGYPEAMRDYNGDGLPEGLQDFNENGMPDFFEDFNGDGKPDVFTDFNGDGTPEMLRDYDGDGIPEGMVDFNGDGTPDALQDFDGDGIPEALADRAGDGDAIPEAFTDFNGDGILEAFLDLDEDGIPEAFTDYDGDGIAEGFTDYDGDGIAEAFTDYDGDRVFEAFLDLDGNGLADAFEDRDGNGVRDGFDDQNGNLLPDFFEDRYYRLISPSHPTQKYGFHQPNFSITWPNFQVGGTGRFFQLLDRSPSTTVTFLNGELTQRRDFAQLNLTPGLWYYHLVPLDQDNNTIPSRQVTWLIRVAGAPVVSSSTHPNSSQPFLNREFIANILPPAGIPSDSYTRFRMRIDSSPETQLSADDFTTANAQVRFGPFASGWYWLHVQAEDRLGNWSETTHHGFIVTEATPSVTSSTHPDQGREYAAREVTASWTPPVLRQDKGLAAPDTTAGFYYLLSDQSSEDPLSRGTFTTSSGGNFSGLLPGTHYLHVRYQDQYGLLSPTTSFRINIRSGAAAPLVSSSTHPSRITAYARRDALAALVDPDATATRFVYTVDQEPDTMPGESDDSTTGTLLNVGLLPVGTSYLHVRSVTRYGELSDVAHFPIHIRLVAAPVIQSSSHPDPRNAYGRNLVFGWSVAEPAYLDGNYFFELDSNEDTIPTETSRTTRNLFLNQPGQADGTYWLHLRARDIYGDLTDVSRFRVTVNCCVPGAPPTPTPSPTPVPTPVPSQRTKEKVIIVAGGGNYLGNGIAQQTRDLANYAYRVATSRGISADNILYLSAFGATAGVDGPATRASLEQGMSSWARDARKVTVFLLDHGERVGTDDWLFLLDGTTVPREGLLASQFDGWLDAVQSGTDPLTELAVVVDMCYAGGFVARCAGSPPGTRRLVIASTEIDRLASYGGAVGNVSFIHSFLSSVFSGLDFNSSYAVARGFIVAMNTPIDAPQRPIFDDDGDGVQTGRDGLVAINWRIGEVASFAALPPELLNARPDATIEEPTDFELWCQLGPNDSGTVRAYVAFGRPLAGEGNPITGYIEIPLGPDPTTPGRWIGLLPAERLQWSGSYSILYTVERQAAGVPDLLLQAIPIGRSLTVVEGLDPSSREGWMMR